MIIFMRRRKSAVTMPRSAAKVFWSAGESPALAARPAAMPSTSATAM